MIRVIDCGVMGFPDALRLQEKCVAAIDTGSDVETLLLVEHPPVYTIGTGGNGANLLDPKRPLIRTNRGGDITWHGPGQLVGYPLVNLGERGRDLHCWLRFLEELLIRTAAEFGVSAWRIPGKTGVWAERGKLAAIGVGVRRWVTMHGFALNVSPDLTEFSRINPCGIPGCPVTSLQQENGHPTELAEVKEHTKRIFRELLPECLPKEGRAVKAEIPDLLQGQDSLKNLEVAGQGLCRDALAVRLPERHYEL
ncbi:MAG TPA: lipoyl(octanoyl) transferase LipB [Geobacteraceae bacterium]|nr:lipoyl(octanoyl) transferase LipB [Geobacteraceae bacterium]